MVIFNSYIYIYAKLPDCKIVNPFQSGNDIYSAYFSISLGIALYNSMANLRYASKKAIFAAEYIKYIH